MSLDSWAYDQLHALRKAGTQRTLQTGAVHGPWVVQDGHERFNFASNDYLGLAGDQALRDRFTSQALFSASSSRLQTGTHEEHTALEHQAALWCGRSVLYTGSGWHTNVGVLSALANRDTTVYADKLVHASLIDGIRLSGATFRRYRHNDLDHLAHLLAGHSRDDRVMVVTESIFSMDGDEVDIAKWVEITAQFPNVITVLDEAHSIGVEGPRGLGLAAREGVFHDIDVLTGPLGKAMASMGGFIGCSEVVKEYLISTARPFLFATALPPIQAAWTSHTLEAVVKADHLRKELKEKRQLLAQGIADITGQDTQACTHIIPIMVGDNHAAKRLAAQLQGLGWQVMAIVPPTVPAGTARLRLSVRADMPDAVLEDFLSDLAELWPTHANS